MRLRVCVRVEWLGERMGWRGEGVEWRACVVCSSSEQQVERLYMILSFRPSAGSWLGVLAYRRPCNHASQCGFIGAASCSSVTADLCGPGSYQCCCGCISRQVASCVKDLPCWVEGRCPFPCLGGSCKIEQNRVRYEQNRVRYEQNRVVYSSEASF